MINEVTKFTLDGVTYEIDSMPDDAKIIFDDISVIEEQLRDLATKTGITNIAKQSLLQKFREYKGELKEFKEVNATPAKKTRAPRKTTKAKETK